MTGLLASAILNARINERARMVTIPRLVLYGNSVFLAGIKAQLEHTAAFELITMEAMLTDVAERIHACRPRAVLFDLAMGYPEFAVALLHEQPGLLLIGVDPNSNELLVLSGQQEQALSTADLIEVVGKDAHHRRMLRSAPGGKQGDPERGTAKIEQITVNEGEAQERGDMGRRKTSENVQFGIIQEE